MVIDITKSLHEMGQSLWLDNITRDLLDSGTLKRYIDDLSVSGITSNPSIFHSAISKGDWYDAEIRMQIKAGAKGEELFFNLAVQDIRRAADLLLPIYERTATVDGYVSLEVSPVFAQNTQATVDQAKSLHEQVGKPNVFIKIPGTKEGLPAIEQSIFAGIPINVTLLFSEDQYKAAAEAYLRGLERRVEAGLSPDVRSVASVFISRWDTAIAAKVPAAMRNTLGLAVAEKVYQAYRDILDGNRFQQLENAGARVQRLLFASTGVKDENASSTLYVDGLCAPNTINTMPEATLKAFSERGSVGGTLSRNGGNADAVLKEHLNAGIDLTALSEQLQSEGAKSFVKSWDSLLEVIDSKSGEVL